MYAFSSVCPTVRPAKNSTRGGVPLSQPVVAAPNGVGKPANSAQSNNVLLDVRQLKKYFPIKRGFFARTVGHVKAVDGVSFQVRSGETLGLVGESGCGKTTTGRVILRAIDPSGGEAWFQDPEQGRVNIATADKRQLKRLRRHMQMVFQDPYASLNPRMTLLQNVGEPLLVNNIANGKELEDRVARLLRVVGLRPEYMNRYPHACSGGQRQRIGIARALYKNADVLVLDEATSALDSETEARVMESIYALRPDLVVLMIAHRLSTLEKCQRIFELSIGKIIEHAGLDAVKHD